MNKNNKFPFKKCFIATAIIVIVAFMVLALLYTFVNNLDSSGGEYLWIWVAAWGGIFGLMLLIYWLYQVYIYFKQKVKNDENKKAGK